MTLPTDHFCATSPARVGTGQTPPAAGGRRAYTLVEILLVVAIITIATIITTPYLVRSIRGNRLRTATSTIIMTGKYARSMALLKQQTATLSLDMSNTTVTVTFPPQATVATPPPAGGSNAMARGDTPATEDGSEAVPEENEDERHNRGGQNPNVKRAIDGVAFTYIETETMGRKTEGIVEIVYESNGRCEPYKIRIEDERGEGVTITVDALASVSTSD